MALPLRASKFILGLLTQLFREIKVMALSLIPCHSPQAQQIAELLLLPYHAPNNHNPVTRGEQGFGSTGDQVVCFT